MYRVHSQILHSNGAITNPPLLSPYSSSYTSSSYSPSVPYVSNYKAQSAPSPTSSSGNRISPAILFIIVILAVVFFILGLLHLLVRFLIKHRSSNSSISQSNRYPDMSESDTYQRQLQQLFHLHDSGLDQAFIDALPVFFYKEIIGLKEPFDCAVCLCEFLEQDKLRLLPMCNHAFHIECIDTWLLSNSTCPLCRGTLYSPGFAFENSAFDFESQLEEDGVSGSGGGGVGVGVGVGSVNKTVESHIVNGKRVFSVRLGKFRSTNNEVERSEGESSSGNLDVRRCYSMGSFQYVVADSDLRVALGPGRGDGGGSGSMRQLKGRAAPNGSFFIDGDAEGKKINIARKGDSFSVSKIWQWSKKDKLTGSSDAHFHNSTATSTLPWMNKARELVDYAI
ncbi:RING-H2 finger protein ATL46, partial [Mucuna pruriens]